jgi:hypothetical protein
MATAAQIQYTAQLNAALAKVQQLQVMLEALATAEGDVSDRVHWGHVGDLQYLNEVLDEALQMNLKRVA